MLYPCKDCLVLPMCSDKCTDYLAFVNSTADKMGEMSADEIAYIIREVPLKIRRKIEYFISDKIRYATERGMEIHDFREKEFTECSATLAKIVS